VVNCNKTTTGLQAEKELDGSVGAGGNDLEFYDDEK
jgi:hypothetical protein